MSSDRVLRWLRWNAPTLAIYPEISSELNESDTLALLASPTNRLQIIDGISNYLEENALQGVTVRLVELPPSRSQVIFVNFLRELGEHLRARQMKLLTEASISTSVRRIREIMEPSDYVILRALDNSPKLGPGPIAAQSWLNSDWRPTFRRMILTSSSLASAQAASIGMSSGDDKKSPPRQPGPCLIDPPLPFNSTAGL